MSLPAATEAASPGTAGEARRFYGYRRRPFFDIRLWQLTGLMVLLMALALYLLPRQRMLVGFYLDRGMTDEALQVVTRLLAERPQDPYLLMEKVRIYERQGRPDQVVAVLKYLVARHPDHAEALERLATQFEWNRRPRQALVYWQRLIRVTPMNIDALRRVIELTRHFGIVPEEVRAVVRLVNLEKRLPTDAVYGDRVSIAQAHRLARDPLNRALTTGMRRLVRLRLGTHGSPFLDETLRELYAVRDQYRRLLQRGDDAGALRQGLRVRVLEVFAQTGLTSEGQHLAAALDRLTGGGVNFRLLLAEVFQWNGLPREAVRLLDDLKDDRPHDPAILTAQAALAQARGDAAAAAQAFLALAEHTDGAPDPLWQAAAQAAQSGRPEMIARVVAAARRLRPGDQALQAALGNHLVAAEDLLAAIALFSDLNRRRPDDAALAERLAELHRWQGRSDVAYRIYARLAEATGGAPAPVDKMIVLAAEAGQPSLLRAALALARRLRPQDTALLRPMAERYLELGDLSAAIDLYRRWLNHAPGDMAARNRLATLYEWTGRPARAYRLLAAQSDGGADVERLLDLAAASQDRGLLRQAVARARLRWPDDAPLQLRMAGRLRDAGDLPAAIELLADYAATHPRNTAARRELAELYGWNGQTQAAARILGDLSDANPGDEDQAMAAADAYLAADDAEKALGFLERAAARRPGDAGLQSRLAEIYGWLERPADQIRVLAALAAQGRLTDEQRRVLVQAYLGQGQGAKAVPLLAGSGRERSLTQADRLLLVEAHSQAGQTTAALSLLRRLADANREDPDLLAELGTRALWLEAPAAAERFFDMALLAAPRHRVALRGSGQALAWIGDEAGAIRRFEAYNRLAPNDYAVRYRLGELYRAGHRTASAHRQYRLSLRLIEHARPQLAAQASAP